MGEFHWYSLQHSLRTALLDESIGTISEMGSFLAVWLVHAAGSSSRIWSTGKDGVRFHSVGTTSIKFSVSLKKHSRQMWGLSFLIEKQEFMKILLLDVHPKSQWDGTIHGKENLLKIFEGFDGPRMTQFVTTVDAVRSLMPCVIWIWLAVTFSLLRRWSMLQRRQRIELNCSCLFYGNPKIQ